MLSQLSLTTNPRFWANGLLAGCIILLTCGCGPDYKARGVVKGTVTTGKKLLTTGTVMFINKEGITGSASIEPDGTYEMKDAPLGECMVTVTVQTLPNDASVRARLGGKGPQMPAGPMNPDEAGPPAPPLAKIPKEVVPIDPKYSKAETSGLKFKVEKGEQTYNIEL